MAEIVKPRALRLPVQVVETRNNDGFTVRLHDADGYEFVKTHGPLAEKRAVAAQICAALNAETRALPDLRTFHNLLRILASIDYPEIFPSSDCPDDALQKWEQFRDDPYHYFIRCDDETAARIWAAVMTRARPAPAAKGK